jgi:hypothetical protein
MKVSFVSALSLLASIARANEFLHLGRLIPPLEPTDEFPVTAAGAGNITGSAFFTQLIDHEVRIIGERKLQYIVSLRIEHCLNSNFHPEEEAMLTS